MLHRDKETPAPQETNDTSLEKPLSPYLENIRRRIDQILNIFSLLTTDVQFAMQQITQSLQRTKQKIGALLSSRERRSSMHITSFLPIAAMTAFIGINAELMSSVEQPIPFAKRGAGHLDNKMDQLFRSLSTLEELSEFLKRNTEYEDTPFPIGFANSYRRSPEEFEDAEWRGPCNNFANFVGEWASRYGYTSYVVSTRPASTSESTKNPWHQFAIICVKKGKQYWIFDNKNIIEWKGSLQEFVSMQYPTHTVVEFGGIGQWRRTRNNVVARFSIHLQQNVSEHEMIECSVPWSLMPAH